MTGEIRILVVDDESSVRNFLKDLLSGEGYQVTAAVSGEEALSHLGNQTFHLVFTDIRMPGISGMDLLKEIKLRKLEAGVIVMTSHSSPELATEVVQSGAYYLGKPFGDIDSILGVVKRVVEKQRLAAETRQLMGKLKRTESRPDS